VEEGDQKVKRALLSFIFLAVVTGCGAGNSLQRQGKASFAAGQYDKCEEQYDGSLKYWFKAAEIKPGEDARIFAGSIAQGYHGRAWCKYKKGQVADALIDIQYASVYFNQICYAKWFVDPWYRKPACKQAGDDKETEALWRKEVAKAK
jgi:tetratricopeptide (TPR) repeat protein